VSSDPTRVSVLGLGRLGAPIAQRLQESGFAVTGWSRSGRPVAGVPVTADSAIAVQDADVVLLVLFDAAACFAVVDSLGDALPANATVVNLSTVAPTEAADLAGRRAGRYVHCPVLGSAPAARAGTLTLLVGAADAPPAAAAVLDAVGRRLPCGDAVTAATLKLVANGGLADAVVAIGRALARARVGGLAPALALDVLERTALGGLVQAKRGWLAGEGGPAQFTAGALRKDAALLAEAVPALASPVGRLLPGEVPDTADIAAVAAAYAGGPSVVDGPSRLHAVPGLDRDPALLAPLIDYARGHASGRPEHFRAAFRPTAHVEGVRDGRFVSWDLDAYCANFSGAPAPDEAERRRTITDLRRAGTLAQATMLLEHGPDAFVDVFLLVREDGAWRIANKAYHRTDLRR